MTLPTSLKIAYAVFIVLLMGTGFWILDWQKKEAELSKLSSLEKIRGSELRESRALALALPGEAEKKRSLKKELCAIIQQEITPEEEKFLVPSYISDVERLVELKGRQLDDPDFSISALTPGAFTDEPVTKNESGEEGQEASVILPRRIFQMQLSGRYMTVSAFLRDLGALKLKRLVTISGLSLSPQGGAEGGCSPVLAVQMPVIAYLRQGDHGN